MTDFADDYKFGDIIYGRFDKTVDYWRYLLEKRKDVLQEFLRSEKTKSNCPGAIKNLTVDENTDYSTLEPTIKNSIDGSQTHILIGYFHKGFKTSLDKAASLIEMKKNVSVIPQRYNEHRETYHRNLYDSRYSPFACLKIDNDTAIAQIGAIANYEEYLRRACKFGVTNIKSVIPEAIIRFVLDDISMSTVIQKEKFPTSHGEAVPITSSELRTLFRTWTQSKGHVVFYKNKSSVPAPWDEKPEEWLDYAKHRYQKYFSLLEKLGKAPPVKFIDASNDAIAIDGQANILKLTYEKLYNFGNH